MSGEYSFLILNDKCRNGKDMKTEKLEIRIG
jgi:hypothetical protein